MKSSIINYLIAIFILLPCKLFGQEIKISYGGKSNSGGPLFSISYLDNHNGYKINTDAMFSNAVVCDDAEEKQIIASININLYLQDDLSHIDNEIWLCLNENLTIRFYYPVGTTKVYSFINGASLYSLSGDANKKGVIDSWGNVIVQPRFEYVIGNNTNFNGITILNDDDSTLVLQCEIFKHGKTKPQNKIPIIVDNKVNRLTAVHNELLELMNPESVSDLTEDLGRTNSENLYINGIQKMLDMDYYNALLLFYQIDDSFSFLGLKENIRVCKKMIRKSGIKTSVQGKIVR